MKAIRQETEAMELVQAGPSRGAEVARIAKSGPRILYLVTEDWYFWSHRLPIARAARDTGYEVVVATRVRDHGERIKDEGFRLIPLRWQRRSLHPWREARALLDVTKIYRRERPDIVHNIALKPSIYGSMAARFAGLPASVNTIAGLGYVFTSQQRKAKMLGPAVRFALRSLLKKPNVRFILQNPDDQETLASFCKPRPGQMVLIRGSGVNVKRFTPRPEPSAPPVVTMVSRMLWDKGVGDLVEASKRLKAQGSPIRFVLVGTPDPENPGSVSDAQLRSWQEAGLIEWRGHQDDIPSTWAASTIAILPTTYGEGAPKALLEAAACGRPIIATDTPGCREIVHHGENGLLVPVNDPGAIVEAIRTLTQDADRRREMGAKGRAHVSKHFTEEMVIRQTLDVYNSMRAHRDE